eukprot:CAMPEP_0194240804 /NCGR_PEP_ID=MMETSP0158-20130606/6873_1 /TAXON_ID=33649 /ORGANISM="Thalassionema nitzschioides, Strain L26-B" /LENGTH=237 /DNA_ID=CAMNT_0038975589 /DNA_START=34 /DNA_END=747 /DNA_ORIENTATION=+
MQHSDEDFFGRHYRNSNSRYNQQFQGNRANKMDGSTKMDNLVLNSPNLIILFTISILVLYHFRGPLIVGVCELRIRQRGLLDVGLDVLETIRYSIETAWNMLSVFVVTPENATDTLTDVTINNPRSRRKRRLLATMPELEETSIKNENATVIPSSTLVGNGVRNLHTHDQTLASLERQKRPGEIEPAFLDPDEYPPGWLLYHPVHGMIRKEELIEINGDLQSHSSNGIGKQKQSDFD